MFVDMTAVSERRDRAPVGMGQVAVSGHRELATAEEKVITSVRQN